MRTARLLSRTKLAKPLRGNLSRISGGMPRPLGLNFRTTIVGDSFGDGGEDQFQFNDIAYWPYALAWTGGAAIRGGCVAVGGRKSSDIINNGDGQIGQSNALNPDATMLVIGYNDYAGGASAATVSANIDTIISQLNSKIIFLGTVTPSFGAVALSGPANTQRLLGNELIKLKSSSRVVIVDQAGLIPWDSSYLFDDLHFNSKGATASGRLWRDKIKARCNFKLTDLDTYMTTPNVLVKNNNPNLVGTGGVAQDSMTGVVANSCSINGANIVSSGVSVVGSKDPVTDHQIMTFSGTYTNANTYPIGFSYIHSFPDFNTGDVVEAIFAFRILEELSPNFLTTTAYCQGFTQDWSQTLFSTFWGASSGPPLNQMRVSDGWNYIRSKAVAIPPGNPPLAPYNYVMFMQFNINTGTAQPVYGKVEIANVALRKIV